MEKAFLTLVNTKMNYGNLLSGFIGAILGSLIASFMSWRIFRKQNKIDRYLSFIEDIDSALNKNEQLASEQDNDKKKELLHEINFLLNKAYSKSMVAMDDTLFSKISSLLDKHFDKKNRNRIYYLMRKDIFGRQTKVKFDDLIHKYIEAKPVKK